MDNKDLCFKTPFTMMVAGPSGSGKTVLVRRILKHHSKLLHPKVSLPLVLWCYGQWQSSYTIPVPNVEIHYSDGLASLDEIQSKKPDIIVVDDLMNELGDDPKMGNLFTKEVTI